MSPLYCYLFHLLGLPACWIQCTCTVAQVHYQQLKASVKLALFVKKYIFYNHLFLIGPLNVGSNCFGFPENNFNRLLKRYKSIATHMPKRPQNNRNHRKSSSMVLIAAWSLYLHNYILVFTYHNRYIKNTGQMSFRHQPSALFISQVLLTVFQKQGCTNPFLSRSANFDLPWSMTLKRDRKFALHPIPTKYGQWNDLIISQSQAIFQLFSSDPPLGEVCQFEKLVCVGA